MSNNSYIITGNGLSVVINGKPYTVDDTNPNYTAIKTAVRNGDWSEIPDLINLTTVMSKYVATNKDILVDVAQSVIYYKHEAIHNSMVSRIFDMMRDGFSIEPMTNLLANLYQNVSMKAIDEMYDFLEYGKMPITEDGHFLAYKRVNDDYTSCYDGTTSNKIGEVTSLPRYKVDDRSEVTCSYGLHICSFEYLRSYPGARVIVVKVNPADVVSIPTDYNNTKARVCRYEVIGELTPEEAGLSTHSFGTSVYVEDQEDEEDTWPDYDEGDDEGDDVTQQEAETSLEELFDDLSVHKIKELFELSISGQLTESDIIQAMLQNKINQLQKQPEPEEELFGAMFGGPEPSDPEDAHLHIPTVNPVVTTMLDLCEKQYADVSLWFKVGYTNGYHAGSRKIDRAPDASLEDDDTGTMTLQNVIDVNVGYSTGYKDGRGHQKRQYPVTTI